jgi:NAD(P)-dependent dehydrogenase (short-subunit alcohol dehydrogenase family)
MARVVITGSTAGLGRAAARHLLDGGHEVVLHARNSVRAGSVDDLADRAAGVVVGDLASADKTRGVADQVNAIGGIDAVIHNAAVYVDPRRVATPEGHARTLAVNVLAPYLLTAWITCPSRLVYLSSGMQKDADASLRDIDWTARSWNGVQAYGDSKLFITALSFAVARRWPDLRAHAVTRGRCRPAWAAQEPRTTSSWALSPRHGWPQAIIPRRPEAAATGTTSAADRRPRPPSTSAFKLRSLTSSSG